VDDYPEFVREFGGVPVTPYGLDDPADRELDRAYQAISRRALECGLPARKTEEPRRE
jgi:hypothetical protein